MFGTNPNVGVINPIGKGPMPKQPSMAPGQPAMGMGIGGMGMQGGVQLTTAAPA
jgi:hypothetical protein